MAATNFRGAYGSDPETYDSRNAGGLLGRLLATVQPNQNLPGNNSDPNPIGAAQFDSGDSGPQGGLLGRLLVLQSEQSPYQPSLDSNGQTAFAPRSPNIARGPTSGDNPAPGQQAPLRRVYIYAPTQHDAPPAAGGLEGPIDPSDTYLPYDSESYSDQGGLLSRLRALQTQQSQYQPAPGNDLQTQDPDFRQVSPRPLSPEAGSPASSEAPTFDPLDIAKSLGIGVANGVVNTVGLPADALAALGYGPGWVGSLSSDALRHSIEERIGPFYQPKSRAARYAETIGEMAPMVLGGEGAGVAMAALRGGQMAARAAAGSALRELPATLAKHAVAPGIAVQALEEALPESKLGQKLQKFYPLARRAIPLVPAATRYLGRRMASY